MTFPAQTEMSPESGHGGLFFDGSLYSRRQR